MADLPAEAVAALRGRAREAISIALAHPNSSDIGEILPDRVGVDFCAHELCAVVTVRVQHGTARRLWTAVSVKRADRETALRDLDALLAQLGLPPEPGLRGRCEALVKEWRERSDKEQRDTFSAWHEKAAAAGAAHDALDQCANALTAALESP